MLTRDRFMPNPLVAALAFAACLAPASAQDLLVRGRLIHTLARTADGFAAPIRDGAVLVRDGTIVAVGPRAEVEAQAGPLAGDDEDAGLRVLEAAVVTPGLVDAHTVVGLAGWLGQGQDQDQIDPSEPLQPELRAIDAYDPRDPLVRWLCEFGVTTIHTGHAPGPVVSGGTLVAKTFGDTLAEVLVAADVAVAATLSGAYPSSPGAPGTRAKAVALLRAELVRASEYRARVAGDRDSPRDAAGDADKDADGAGNASAGKAPPTRDLRLEALASVLAGERPLLVTAHRAHDIQTALRLAEEFGFRCLVDGGAESYLLIDELRAAGCAVLLHPPMARSTGELANASMETAATLVAAGIPVALQSGYENYVPKTRVVLFEAAIAARHGLEFTQALALITLAPAEILGIDDRVGSLEVGKDGDLALYDGDPFEYATHCVGVVVEGRIASSTVR